MVISIYFSKIICNQIGPTPCISWYGPVQVAL